MTKLILLLTISATMFTERSAAGPVAHPRPAARDAIGAPGPVDADIAARAARDGVALHRVRRGETLAAIARAYGVPAGLLADLNRLRSPSRMKAGSLLVVPLTPKARRAAAAIARRHARTGVRARVRPGDSLWSIARRHGVTVKELARWNGIRRPREHKLRAGRLLVVRRARCE